MKLQYVIILLLLSATLLMKRCGFKYEVELQKLNESLADTVRQLKSENGRLIYETSNLQTSNYIALKKVLSDADANADSLSALVSELRIALDNKAKEASAISAVGEVSDTIPVTDEVWKDKNLSYQKITPNYSIDFKIDSTSFSYNCEQYMNLLIYKKNKKIFVESSNPNVKITGIEGYSLLNKQKRFSIGLQMGIGVTPESVSPYLGLGLSYNLYSF